MLTEVLNGKLNYLLTPIHLYINNDKNVPIKIKLKKYS